MIFAIFWRVFAAAAVGYWAAEDIIPAAIVTCIAFWVILAVFPIDKPKWQDPWRRG